MMIQKNNLMQSELGHYVEVFNVLSAGYTGYGFALISFGICVFTAFLAYLMHRHGGIRKTLFEKNKTENAKWLLIVFSGTTFLFSIGMLINTYDEYVFLCQQLRWKQYRTIEGVVADFQRIGHRDVFSVGNEFFKVDGDYPTSAFHQLSRFGGPINQGAKVRLYYLDKKSPRLGQRILKIELWEKS